MQNLVDIPISEAFGYSLLGIAVVFVVLVFLMCITYIMAAVFKSRAGKSAAAVTGSAGKADAPPPAAKPEITATEADVPKTAEKPETAAVSAEQARTASAEPVLRQYAVMVNGVQHIVDAELVGASAPTAAAAPAPAVAATEAVPAAGAAVQVQSPGGAAGKRKFTVMVNGVKHEVDAEIVDNAGVNGK